MRTARRTFVQQKKIETVTGVIEKKGNAARDLDQPINKSRRIGKENSARFAEFSLAIYRSRETFSSRYY